MFEPIKRLIPEEQLKIIRPIGHGFLAYAAAVRFGFPANKMVVIGVTGTAGKSTTIQMLASILNFSKEKAGYITTIGYFDGNNEYTNFQGMSMPGGWRLQKSLEQMRRNGCKYALVECTSEGLAQNRHIGINFDCAIFTNLSPTHLDAHGGLENYKHAKGILFNDMTQAVKKNLFHGKKIIGVNLDDDNALYFSSFPADIKFGVSFNKDIKGENSLAEDLNKDSAESVQEMAHVYKVGQLQELADMTSFKIDGVNFEMHVPGKFNADNASMAAATANMLGVSMVQCADALRQFHGLPGRMEKIPNNKGIEIYVDYAPAPQAMFALLQTISRNPHKKIIHVFGAPGGTRDVATRFEFGKISAQFADSIIITNDDVYDTDPNKIAADIRQGITQAQQKKVTDILMVLDRKEAIQKALGMAEPGDIVVFTGKGSEQFLVLPGNKRIEWDDRAVIRELL